MPEMRLVATGKLLSFTVLNLGIIRKQNQAFLRRYHMGKSWFEIRDGGWGFAWIGKANPRIKDNTGITEASFDFPVSWNPLFKVLRVKDG